MHKISLAPVLSATFSRDSCWIMSYLLVVSPVPSRALRNVSYCGSEAGPQRSGLLLGLLDDLDQPPALGGAQRTGLHDPDPVADAGAIGLVVRLHPARLAEHLAVQPVLHPVLDRD